MKKKISELAAEFRAEMKRARIKCHIKSYDNHFYISVPDFKAHFTPEQIRHFCQYAKDMGLVFVMNTPIDVELQVKLTGKQQWDFYRGL